jgi:hypothetical protein
MQNRECEIESYGSSKGNRGGTFFEHERQPNRIADEVRSNSG